MTNLPDVPEERPHLSALARQQAINAKISTGGQVAGQEAPHSPSSEKGSAKGL